VGRATTQAMVAASVIMVISDLFITQLLLNFFPFK
jgi:ABC-type transporter Mla maintaining outer membrane lipid asymmetry permease subunit MlaE